MVDQNEQKGSNSGWSGVFNNLIDLLKKLTLLEETPLRAKMNILFLVMALITYCFIFSTVDSFMLKIPLPKKDDLIRFFIYIALIIWATYGTLYRGHKHCLKWCKQASSFD